MSSYVCRDKSLSTCPNQSVVRISLPGGDEAEKSEEDEDPKSFGRAVCLARDLAFLFLFVDPPMET